MLESGEGWRLGMTMMVDRGLGHDGLLAERFLDRYQEIGETPKQDIATLASRHDPLSLETQIH